VSFEACEARTLLSAARVTWNVSWNDPGGAWDAYYADIERVVRAAGEEWGRLFDSSASMEVQVSFSQELATSSGHSLATAFVDHNPDGFDIYEMGAAAEINTGIDPNGAAPDVEITLGVNPGANYLTNKLWFDPDPGTRSAVIPAGRVDAMSVMMHELGHAIGYNGWTDPVTGQLPGNYASTFDQYVYQENGYAYFGGLFAHDANGGVDPALTLGSPFHWGNAAPGPGADLATQVMNGVTLAAQTRYEISPLDVAVMNDIGMSMDVTPPAVVSSAFEYAAGQSVRVRFDESVRGSLDASDFTLVRTGPGAASVIPASAVHLSYDRATDVATLTFGGMPGGALPDGNYQLTLVGAGVGDTAGNLMAADATLNFFTLAGDANHDRSVDFNDLVALAQNYNTVGKTFAQGDFNNDGNVDFNDLVILAQRYNTTLAAPGVAAFTAPGAAMPTKRRRTVFSSKPVTARAAPHAVVKRQIRPARRHSFEIQLVGRERTGGK
jgi:hypothetical protein